MTREAGIVIVGASLAGVTTAEALRSEGYAGPITLVGAEDHLPYARPPLSKQVLSGKWSVDQATLLPGEALRDHDVRFLRGRRAIATDLRARTVTVEGGILPFERLVAATGVTARRLPNPRRLSGIHSLRTVDDVSVLRRDLEGARRVAVVGAGVLGCEIAAAARIAGHKVTVIGRTVEPRFGYTGGHISARIADLLLDHRVKMRMGVAVCDMVGSGRVSSLALSDGSVVAADVVVGAIGSTPVVGWLTGAGIDLSDGVLCDENGVAAPDVYAVGDVARWRDPLTEEAHRVEHQATAIEQAHAVARLIACGQSTPRIESFFWSELFGNRILVHGRLEAELPLTTVAGDAAGSRFVAATIRDGRTTGIVGWNMPREFRLERARLMNLATEHAEELKGMPVR